MPTFGPSAVGSWAISPAVMPMLHLPGLMMPGQFGPSSRVPGWSRSSVLKTLASSCAGMPSVMHTMKAMPAAAASRMAAGAAFGGTATNDAVAPVAATASATVSKIGMPSTSVPPLPGVTPPTTCVPYALLRRPWYLPCPPVRPWTITLVSALTKMAMSVAPVRRVRRPHGRRRAWWARRSASTRGCRRWPGSRDPPRRSCRRGG